MPTKRTRRLWRKRAADTHPVLKWPVAALLATMLFFALNWTYQVAKKPSELFFPISGSLHKTPGQTWDAYAASFREHATPIITADFLAALAQVEASGNPLARTYWRWSNTLNPFEVYRPASSAVGMYQFSDGTFEEAKAYCIEDHRVVLDGPWDDPESCWFNGLYTRVLPSHSIELASAYLDVKVRDALRRHPVPGVSLRDKQELAALIHLCGAGAGRRHARRSLGIPEGMKCGTHDLWTYLEKVRVQQTHFQKLMNAP
ncbi:MAG: lytic transglycosylase domain-containing protein [Myxococcota bacterium]